jgi:hypothetical protein
MKTEGIETVVGVEAEAVVGKKSAAVLLGMLARHDELQREPFTTAAEGADWCQTYADLPLSWRLGSVAPLTALFAVLDEHDVVLGMDCLVRQGGKTVSEWAMKSARLGDRCCIGFSGSDAFRNPIFCRYLVERPCLEAYSAPLSVWECANGDARLDYDDAKRRLERGIKDIVQPLLNPKHAYEIRFGAILIGERGGVPYGCEYVADNDWKGEEIAGSAESLPLGWQGIPNKQYHDYTMEEVAAIRQPLFRHNALLRDRVRGAIRAWAATESNRKRCDVNSNTVVRALSECCVSEWEPPKPRNLPAQA